MPRKSHKKFLGKTSKTKFDSDSIHNKYNIANVLKDLITKKPKEQR